MAANWQAQAAADLPSSSHAASRQLVTFRPLWPIITREHRLRSGHAEFRSRECWSRLWHRSVSVQPTSTIVPRLSNKNPAEFSLSNNVVTSGCWSSSVRHLSLIPTCPMLLHKGTIKFRVFMTCSTLSRQTTLNTCALLVYHDCAENASASWSTS